MPAKKTTTSATSFSQIDFEVSPKLIAQAIYVYQANSHRGISKTKTRGEVSATTKKIYKQKGTGNARHGAKSAPIYVGGGVVFGPQGIVTPLKSLNKKMRLKALAGLLTTYKKEERLSLIDATEIKSLSTKSADKLLPKDYSKVSCALVHFSESSDFLKSVSNLNGLELLSAKRLNVYNLGQHAKVVLTQTALEHLLSRLAVLKSANTK